jgi:hypothetical protein
MGKASIYGLFAKAGGVDEGLIVSGSIAARDRSCLAVGLSCKLWGLNIGDFPGGHGEW